MRLQIAILIFVGTISSCNREKTYYAPITEAIEIKSGEQYVVNPEHPENSTLPRVSDDGILFKVREFDEGDPRFTDDESESNTIYYFPNSLVGGENFEERIQLGNSRVRVWEFSATSIDHSFARIVEIDHGELHLRVRDSTLQFSLDTEFLVPVIGGVSSVKEFSTLKLNHEYCIDKQWMQTKKCQMQIRGVK